MNKKAIVRSATIGSAGPVEETVRCHDCYPNGETIEAIRQVEAGEDLIEYADMNAFLGDYERYKRGDLLYE